MWTTQSILRTVQSLDQNARLISYLPLSHIAAQLLDLHCAMHLGCAVYFAPKDALKGTGLLDILQKVKPTVFLSVPRVWEKIYEKLKAKLEQKRALRDLIRWSMAQGSSKSQSLTYRCSSAAPGCGYGIASALVLGKLRDKMGLSEAKLVFTGAAPIQRECLDFFASLGLPIYDIYGQSETCGPHSFNYPSYWKIGSSGLPLMGAETKLDGDTSEIMIRGPHVSSGYWGGSDSASFVDSDGWFRTGDEGKFDDDGFLYITGRLKDIIITSGGENVAPIPIEAAIKAEIGAEHVVLVGDKRKYLTALIVGPLEEGKCAKDAIQAINAKATSPVHTIKRWTIIDATFSVETGELTPTFKLRRRAIITKFEGVIEAMYAP